MWLMRTARGLCAEALFDRFWAVTRTGLMATVRAASRVISDGVCVHDTAPRPARGCTPSGDTSCGNPWGTAAPAPRFAVRYANSTEISAGTESRESR
jgi:hypothetical protein